MEDITPNQLVAVKVEAVMLDIHRMPVVILKDSSNRVLPIWIGHCEAQSILIALEGEKPQRPLTHDLLKNVIETMGAEVEKIVISSIKQNVYYAILYLRFNGEVLKIDSRPSDAIGLAVRTNSPIFVNEVVLNQAHISSSPITEEDIERFKQELEKIDTIDFKKLQEEEGL